METTPWSVAIYTSVIYFHFIFSSTPTRRSTSKLGHSSWRYHFALPSFVPNCILKVLWTPGLTLTCLSASIALQTRLSWSILRPIHFICWNYTLGVSRNRRPYHMALIFKRGRNSGPKVARWSAIFKAIMATLLKAVSRALDSNVTTNAAIDHGPAEHPS